MPSPPAATAESPAASPAPSVAGWTVINGCRIKPVRQTIDGNGTGDCFPACIASVIGCDIAEVPNFCAAPDDDGCKWFGRAVDWLEERGYGVIAWDWDTANPWITPGLPIITAGRSPRSGIGTEGFLHSVISTRVMSAGPDEWRFEWVHDPHPSGLFIEGDPKDAIVIVPLAASEPAAP